jgi:membrane-bound serine protease (ClpP class)
VQDAAIFARAPASGRAPRPAAIRSLRLALLATVVLVPAVMPDRAAAQERGLAYSVALERDIDRAAARALERTFDDARRRRATVVILRLDTPGGLISSTREMVKTIAAAPMPVIVYVHPSGARADSAGLVLTLAGDVAAMAPQTNIGSATPVRIGPSARTPSEDQLLQDLRRKAINDTVAFVRTLAEDHGHNADLAERMVRTAENVTASKALEDDLIDVLVPTEQALLQELDGFAIKGRKAQVLRTGGMQIKRFDGLAVSFHDLDGQDNFSWQRFVAYIAVGLAIIALVVTRRFSKARAAWYRRRRRRRREELQRRRSVPPGSGSP